MTADEVTALLRELTAGTSARVSITDGVAQIELPVSPEGRTARVGVPGSGWYALAVDDGFSLDHFGEDYTAAEITDILQELLAVGIAYLDHGGTIRKPNSFWPALVVHVGPDDFELRRSFVDEVRRVARRWRPGKRSQRG